jgi:hypothetical protein
MIVVQRRSFKAKTFKLKSFSIRISSLYFLGIPNIPFFDFVYLILTEKVILKQSYFLLNIYDVLHTKAIEMIELILYIKLQ